MRRPARELRVGRAVCCSASTSQACRYRIRISRKKFEREAALTVELNRLRRFGR